MWKDPRLAFFLILLAILSPTARSDLVVSRVERRVDLTSHIVRIITTLKVENEGPAVASDALLAIPNVQAKNLANLMAFFNEGRGKGSAVELPVAVVHPEGMPPELTFYSVSFPKELENGASLTFIVLTIFTHSLTPFPAEITQSDTQLVVYQDSAYYLSPYAVKVQTLSIRLPSGRVEAYTKHPNGKLEESDIKYGPFENLPAFSYSSVIVHFENNHPFAVAHEVVREIEISHWGNVQVTEHYKLVHGGAQNKGGFSRFDYQSGMKGISSFRQLVARLPPRAHSVYYRDEIGNISTSHLWGDSKKTQLEIEPRYPMFGGWRTYFTIGYGLPLKDFLFEKEGKRFLNITFGCPFHEVVIDNIIVKVVLPEGSKEISASTPFPTEQHQEIKYSHLDISGRPVVVLQKSNIVPEHNQHFQVKEKVQLVQNIVKRCLVVHDKLEASLHDLSRTGDVQSCKLARKTADALLKDLAKELKPLLGYLQSSPQASQIWPKVEELVAKEKEMQERLMQKHSTVVDCFEKKLGGKEVENRVAPHQQKLAILRQDIGDLLEIIDEFC